MMQASERTNIDLLNTLENEKNNQKEVLNLLNEINYRLDLGTLTFKAEENKYLYLYMLLSNKMNDLKHLNILLNDKNFIELIDETKVNGSTILSLTDKCTKPREVLLKNSKNIKNSIVKSDELFATKDFLYDLSIEEIKILRSDIDIDNYLVMNGLRFDALTDKTIKSLLDEIILFKNYDINTIRDFANGYEDPKKTSS